MRFEVRYLFAASGEELVSPNELRFPTHAELTRSLTGAGFPVEHVVGDWNRRVGVENSAMGRDLGFAVGRMCPTPGRQDRASWLFDSCI